ncbi:PiggyBac transposable element-derived protein 4 [Trichinella pseudospiralis]|uniref:PiggyBac transposable element-derived protein 4 n=1 Tax=Trichinella pseudospiralis TaxID=6337 RepID=A0A0V1FL67_TRIPS|nr:PiggyBac transposable element-derived protein 4 [Trichinella pseudospiralis]
MALSRMICLLVYQRDCHPAPCGRCILFPLAPYYCGQIIKIGFCSESDNDRSKFPSESDSRSFLDILNDSLEKSDIGSASNFDYVEKSNYDPSSEFTSFLSSESETKEVMHERSDLWIGRDHECVSNKQGYPKMCKQEHINIYSGRAKTTSKLTAIRMVFDSFVRNCAENYMHSLYVTIDKVLLSFKGRCPFQMYILTKAAKYGIKIFKLSDSETSYVSKMEMYVGKQNEGSYQMVPQQYSKGFSLHSKSSAIVKLTAVRTLRKNKKLILAAFIETKHRELSKAYLDTREI